MALDRAALKQAESGIATLRIYGWKAPAVTLGKSQKREEIAPLFPNLPLIHRPSGGGAVLHGADVTVALAMPLAMLGVAPRALRETYARMVAPLARALTACGLPCHLAEEQAGGPSRDCFASAGRMDLLHRTTGKKVAGCALAATRAAALLHVSVPARPLPRWLDLDEATKGRYTNSDWRWEWLVQALPAALRQDHRVTLKVLDPDLSAQERAGMMLWHEVDPLGVNAELGALGEYDRYAPEFAAASTPTEFRAAVERLSEWTGTLPVYDEAQWSQRQGGFTL